MRKLTVLTGLVFVITESTVEGCKLSELVTLELVLAFWDGSSLDSVSMNKWVSKWWGE
jgi:hypothetical protein